ncbi:MAG: FAD-dependent thymidylate synthase [Methanomassiliicoccaceae archaeon]|nr:FAD-dependent thymidylate synthase [Methanomassiliicoccaceae archaeon]
MIVELLAFTPNADKICASAGNSCYSNKPSHELMDDGDDPSRVLSKIVGMGHHSVLEHAVFTFSVQAVSRALTHQLVRHRIASFSQQSQRYVSLDEPTYIIPETIMEDPDSLEAYVKTMDGLWKTYRKLCDRGVPAEDARYVLPNGCTTNITITMNARELLHFFSLRVCSRSQWEIRDMAERMLKICKDISPVIFAKAGPPCLRGKCPEGKLSCGKPRLELL